MLGNALTHKHQMAGRWMKGHSAGGSRNSSSYSSNPKYWLKVCEKGEVLVSLLQHRKWRHTEKYAQTPLENGGNTKHQHYQAIALHMWKVCAVSCSKHKLSSFLLDKEMCFVCFKVEKKRFNLSRTLNKPPCASTHCHAYEREVVLHGQLEPGYYLLIPSSYQPGAEARFLVRVFASSSTSLWWASFWGWKKTSSSCLFKDALKKNTWHHFKSVDEVIHHEGKKLF